MKKGLLTTLAIVFVLLGVGLLLFRPKTELIQEDIIYFFTKDMCPYCHQATAYITEQYPHLEVSFKNIADEENMTLLMACADKFQLDKRRLGTPLICMGDTYVLGWSDAEKAKFDTAVKAFLKQSQVN